MRFGIYDHVERRHDVGQAQQYEERLQLLELADAAGFYCYHVAEHHHAPLSLSPNQGVYLAAVAQRTKHIRLTSLVYVLPLHHPIRLIEEICMLDNLSGGRFEVGVGRGVNRAQEFRMWGGDDAENDARFEETLDIVIQGLQNDFVTHDGKFFQFKDLWMELRPYQCPHPPFWWPGNAAHAGQRGMNFVGGGRSTDPGEIRGAMQRYLAAYQQSPTRERCGRAEPLYGPNKHVYIARTDGEARERAIVAFEEFRKHYFKPLPGGRVNEEDVAPPGKVGADAAIESGGLIFGSPETIRTYVKRFVEESGANYFVGSFIWGDLSHKEARQSLELFASEVMPAVSGARAASA